MTSLQNPKVSLEQAAHDLESLASKIDSMDQIGPETIALFEATNETVKDSVDRRIKYLSYLKSAIGGAKEMKEMWANRQRVLEATEEWIKQLTKELIAQHPDRRYRGDLGELKLQKNSIDTLILEGNLAELDKRPLSPEEVMDDDGNMLIDDELLLSRFFLDTALIKSMLKDGKVVQNARLERGEHLRVKI